ncbi:MAG TPA: hypothetical protein VN840_18595 [Streptosporangiaceae bacterium]|nr:hypothetical protein [Streptosporangiaceae bacterium]
MGAARLLTRRLAAGLGAICAGAGVALTAAGTAQAAVPDHWGFAYVSQPSVPGTPDLAHQAGSWPAPFKVHTTPGVVGQVIVRFPRIASKGGVVHVTAITDERPIWCQVQKWGPSGTDEVVVVRCYQASAGPAVPVFTPFTVMYTTSSKAAFPAGQAYGYVHFQPGPGVVAQFNSAGGSNTVTSGPVGVWVVTMPGLGSAVQSGGVQVSAVDPAGPAKCELSGWAWSPGRQQFQVRCFDGTTNPLKTGWTLSYQRKRAITGGVPKHFAYTFNNKPLIAGPYAPAPPPVNFSSAGAVNTIRSAGAGLSLVQLPRVGASPDDVLVTPFKVGPGFCNLVTLWALTGGVVKDVIVRDVACFTATGTLKSQASLISYTSAH